MDEMDASDITTHYPMRPQVKTHNAPKDPNAPPEVPDVNASGAMDPDPEPMETRSDGEPSWLKKMMSKLKKSFCLKLDMQDRMYEEHVNAKKDRQHQKQLLRHFQLPVSDGSENSITPEEKWLSKQHWSSSEDEAGPSTIPGGWVNTEPWGA